MAYPNILIPVDGSEHSMFACKLAVKLAKDIPGQETMHLVHCFPPIPGIIGGSGKEELVEEHKKEAEAIFAPYKKLFEDEGFPCKTYVLFGDIGQSIAQAAEDYNCDLIIMGTRGMNELKSLILGNVSHDVLQYAKVPVLLAKM